MGSGRTEHGGYLGSMVRVRKVAAAEQTGSVAEQPRPHGVALAGDGVGARADLADVAGQKGQIDYCLGGAYGLMALVHAHGPPEGDPLPLVYGVRQILDPAGWQAGGCGRTIEVVVGYMVTINVADVGG